MSPEQIDVSGALLAKLGDLLTGQALIQRDIAYLRERSQVNELDIKKLESAIQMLETRDERRGAQIDLGRWIVQNLPALVAALIAIYAVVHPH